MALTHRARVLLLVGLGFCLLAVASAAHAQIDEVDAGYDDKPTPIVTTLDNPDPDALQTAFRRMKRVDGVQWELRTDLPERREPRDTPRWLQAIANALAAFLEFLGPVFTAVFWIGLGALALVLLYAIFNSLRGMSFTRDEMEDEAVPEYRPSARLARVLLEQADALAAEGRYAEAIHLLLYRSIQDIEQARPTAVRLSLTSREIADSPALGAQTRATFSQLARTVERSHFGGQAVGADDYARARRLYEDFAGRAPNAEPMPSLIDGAAT